jgi:copper chaperone CopZ
MMRRTKVRAGTTGEEKQRRAERIARSSKRGEKYDMVKQVFRVPDMHCTACVMRLEGIEDELAGITRINANYRKQQMEVEYDEGQVNPDQIIEAAKRHGYEAIPQ